MMKRISYIVFLMLLAVAFSACGGEKPAEPQETPTTAAEPAPAVQESSDEVVGQSKYTKISEFSDVWSTLYNQNEAAINNYEGMPIMGLVTPQLSFVLSVQYDALNLENRDGRYEGQLILAGYPGFVEKAGDRITFGSEYTREKDGFGPGAKAGDKVVNSGFLDLGTGCYHSEEVTERAGRKISRSVTEFKVLEDGSMICVDFRGNAFDVRGEEALNDQVIFLHNGTGRYDFVVANGKTGPEFNPFSFAEKGNLTKEQAIELFQTAGYTLDKVGGIQDGKLVLDPVN